MTAALAIAAACLALALLSGWRGARPPDPARGVRLVPWRLLMMLGSAGFVTALGVAAAFLKQAASG